MTFRDLETLFRNLVWVDAQWIVVLSLQLYHEKNNGSSIKLSSLNLWKQLLKSQCKQMIINQITKKHSELGDKSSSEPPGSYHLLTYNHLKKKINSKEKFRLQ